MTPEQARTHSNPAIRQMARYGDAVDLLARFTADALEQRKLHGRDSVEYHGRLEVVRWLAGEKMDAWRRAHVQP